MARRRIEMRCATRACRRSQAEAVSLLVAPKDPDAYPDTAERAVSAASRDHGTIGVVSPRAMWEKRPVEIPGEVAEQGLRRRIANPV